MAEGVAYFPTSSRTISSTETIVGLERRAEPDRARFAGILAEELASKNMSRQGLATATKKLARVRKDRKLSCAKGSLSRWCSRDANDGRVPSVKQLLAIGVVLKFGPPKWAEPFGCFYVLPSDEQAKAGRHAGVSVPLRAPWYRRRGYRQVMMLGQGMAAVLLAIFLVNSIRDSWTARCPEVDSLDGTIGLALQAVRDERCGFTTSLSTGQATISCPDWWLCHVEMVGRGNVLVVGPMDDIDVQGDMTLRYRPSYGGMDLVQYPCAFAERKAYPNDPEWKGINILDSSSPGPGY